MNKLIKWWWCSLWGLHEWTSKADSGIAMKFNSFEELLDYSTCYCKHCGKINTYSEQFNNRAREREQDIERLREQLKQRR